MLYMFFMREVPFHDETLHLKDGTFLEWNLGTSSGGGGEVPVAGNLVIFINWNLVQILALDTFVVGDRSGDCSSKCCAL